MEVLDVPVDNIWIGDRQREDMGDVEQLKFSIDQYGILQPIIVESMPDGRYRLIAGGRRLAACKLLKKETIPARTIESLSIAERQEIELEENVIRKNLLWWEQAQAIAKLHKTRREQYLHGLPGRLGKFSWGQKDTAETLGFSEATISYNLRMAEEIERYPFLTKAKNYREAIQMLRDAAAKEAQPDENEALRQIKECFTLDPFPGCLENVEPASVNLIITDLTNQPLADSLEQIIPKLVITGQFFFFLPIEFLSLADSLLTKMGVNHKSYPLIWHIKGEDHYQVFMWASRGMADLPMNLPHHFSHRRDCALSSLSKPASLYYRIVDVSSKKGDFVLDPCSYDLALVRVCRELGRNVRSYCSNGTLFEQALLDLGQKKSPPTED